MPDPKNITETTTIAELSEQCLLLGVIALHLHQAADGDGRAASVRHEQGFFVGTGPTEAAAIEAAFIKLRRALLPDPLKQYLEEI